MNGHSAQSLCLDPACPAVPGGGRCGICHGPTAPPPPRPAVPAANRQPPTGSSQMSFVPSMCPRRARQSSAGTARNMGARVESRFRGRRDPPLIGARSGGKKSLGMRRTRGGRPFVGCKVLAKSHHRRYGFSSCFCRPPAAPERVDATGAAARTARSVHAHKAPGYGPASRCAFQTPTDRADCSASATVGDQPSPKAAKCTNDRGAVRKPGRRAHRGLTARWGIPRHRRVGQPTASAAGRSPLRRPPRVFVSRLAAVRSARAR